MRTAGAVFCSATLMTVSTNQQNRTSLTREDIVSLARLVALGRSDALADALISAPEPQALLDAVQHHGLAPVFHVFTRRRPDVPSPIAERLRKAYVQNRARVTVMLSEAARVSTALEAAGIPCVPLKGAALAEDLYGDPAMRPMMDVDLLIPYDRLREARRIVAGLGYAEELLDLRQDFEEHFRNEIVFFRAAPLPCRIELHWGLLNFGGNEPWTAEAFARSVLTPKGRRLTDEDTLLHLAAHAAYHHQNDRVMWELDIALLLQTRGAAIDFEQVGDTAQVHRLMMPLRWAADTGARLGVPPPPAMQAVIGRRVVGRLERWALRFASDPELAPLVRLVMTLRSTRGLRAKLSLLAAKLFPDRRHLQVGHEMRGFWPWIYTVRIVRLAGKIVRGLARRSVRHLRRPA